jgi:hypothetical protein
MSYTDSDVLARHETEYSKSEDVSSMTSCLRSCRFLLRTPWSTGATAGDSVLALLPEPFETSENKLISVYTCYRVARSRHVWVLCTGSHFQAALVLCGHVFCETQLREIPHLSTKK